MISQTLPLELVSETFQYVVDFDIAPVRAGYRSKSSWSEIGFLSTLCRSYRPLFFQAWFVRLISRDKGDLDTLRNLFPYTVMCVKELHCVQDMNDRSKAYWNLSGYPSLRSLRLDWISTREPTRNTTVPLGPGNYFINTKGITKLALVGDPYPYPLICLDVATNFPELREFEMDQGKAWCSLCHTSNEAVGVAGMDIVYEGEKGLGLPILFSRFLKTLEQLHSVSLTIGSIRHSDSNGLLSITGSEDADYYAGECPSCTLLLSWDPTLRGTYGSRKRGIPLISPLDELGRNRQHVYEKPPMLKRVQWKFRPLWEGETEDVGMGEDGYEQPGEGEDVGDDSEEE